MIKNFLIFSSLLLILSGCAGATKIDVLAKPIEIDVAKAADPDPIQLSPITFKVITKDNLNDFIAQLSKDQSTQKPVFIAISISDYENLSSNLAEIKRYIEQDKAVIVYYRSMVAPSTAATTNKPITPAN